MELQDILLEISKLTPVIGVLIWVIFYFKAEITAKNNEIRDLNIYIRENDRQTLVTMNKLCDAVDSLKEIIKEKLK